MSKKTKPIAELKSCYFWTCDECGQDNFAMPIKAEMGDDERQAHYREAMGLDEWAELPEDWQNFEMVMIPNEVACGHCGEIFATEDERTVL